MEMGLEMELRLEAVVVVAVLAVVQQEAIQQEVVCPVLTPECIWDPASTRRSSSLHALRTCIPGEVLEGLDIVIRVSIHMELKAAQIDRNAADMDLNASQRTLVCVHFTYLGWLIYLCD